MVSFIQGKDPPIPIHCINKGNLTLTLNTNLILILSLNSKPNPHLKPNPNSNSVYSLEGRVHTRKHSADYHVMICCTHFTGCDVILKCLAVCNQFSLNRSSR